MMQGFQLYDFQNNFSLLPIIFFTLLQVVVEKMADKMASDMKVYIKHCISLYGKELHPLTFIDVC